MIFLLAALALLSGCFSREEALFIPHIYITPESSFMWDLEHAHELVVKTDEKYSAKKLEKILKIYAQDKLINYKIKSRLRDELFSVIPDKKALEPGVYHQVYIESELKYIFYVMHKAAQLINHTFTHVTPERKNFLLVFDQPIILTEDNALEIISDDLEKIKLKQIRISPDKLNMSIYLDNNMSLSEDKKYKVIFNNFLTLDNKKIILDTLEFVPEAEDNQVHEQRPIFYRGYEKAEIIWPQEKLAHTELYLAEDFTRNYRRLTQTYAQKIATQDIVLSDLKPNSAYHVIARTEDLKGNIELVSGVFTTLDEENWRFSEIFINARAGEAKKADFIELIYTGTQAKEISQLSLLINKRKCDFISLAHVVIAQPGDYILLVGSDFDEHAAQIPARAHILRSTKKNLCGRLPKSKPALIRLVSKNRLLDTYSSHAWEGKKSNESIVRLNPRGLDERDNYCYSDPLDGPTPGGPARRK
jgi:hypothetical protein